MHVRAWLKRDDVLTLRSAECGAPKDLRRHDANPSRPEKTTPSGRRTALQSFKSSRKAQTRRNGERCMKGKNKYRGALSLKIAGQRVAGLGKLAARKGGQDFSQGRSGKFWLLTEGWRQDHAFFEAWDADAQQTLRTCADNQLEVCDSGRT